MWWRGAAAWARPTHGDSALSFTAPNECKVLVVGDCMLDRYWQGRVVRISPEAPVPVVHMNSQSDRLGGAANVALNARHLGARVGLLGVLGQDEPGRTFLRILKEQDITSHVLTDPGIPTVVKLRVVSQGQQLLRVDFEEILESDRAVEVSTCFARLVQGCTCVVFSDYNKGSLLDIGTMIKAAKAHNCQVIVDPKGSDYGPYRGADVITPNRSELATVVGAWRSEDELNQKAFALRRDLGIGSLLLTRSEQGMSLFFEVDGQPCRTDYQAAARDVYDVTGAGDTVIATLAVMLAEGQSLMDATRIANRAAGLVVGKFGTSSVSRAELFDPLPGAPVEGA